MSHSYSQEVTFGYLRPSALAQRLGWPVRTCFHKALPEMEGELELREATVSASFHGLIRFNSNPNKYVKVF